MFTYDCPNCGEEMKGSFGDNVYCKSCNKTYETDWDYVGGDYDMAAWLTSVEYEGKVDVPEEEQ